MLLQVHPGNQLAFFEIAATLIPLLLFGGVVAERVGPTGKSPGWLLGAGIVIVLIGCYAIAAEALAIDVIVTGKPNVEAEAVILVFLLGGMIGVLIALVSPWYKRLRTLSDEEDQTQRAESHNEGQQDTPRELPRSGKAAVALAGLCALFIASMLVATVPAMVTSLAEAGENQFSEARSAAITQKTTEEAAVRSRVLSLWVAVGKVEQQAVTALVHDEPSAIVDGYQSELSALRARLTVERGHDKDLVQAIAKLRHCELHACG